MPLVLDLKRGKTVVIGYGESEVSVTVTNHEAVDGEVVTKLTINAPDHVCIDRLSVRERRTANIDRIFSNATGTTEQS